MNIFDRMKLLSLLKEFRKEEFPMGATKLEDLTASIGLDALIAMVEKKIHTWLDARDGDI